jgi:hypothetical protein
VAIGSPDCPACGAREAGFEHHCRICGAKFPRPRDRRSSHIIRYVWHLRATAIVGIFTIVVLYLPIPGELDLAVVILNVALIAALNVYVWQLRRRHPEERFDIRRLVHARIKVSFPRGGRTWMTPSWLSGSIIFVWEFGNRTEVLVQLDTPIWDTQMRWDFVALVPLSRGLRFVTLMRDGRMDVHIFLAGQRELDRLRQKLRGLRRPTGPPILRVGQGRVSFIGRGS